ncbi:AMP-dependent synthetase/ligase [Antrihabitans sp. NCIMB 15449]|uniref:Acyl-CoA synthetase n=1 Tax=Antrihabitans spumae TaxID=3373370 RepID=A0ABW7JIQ0_9NOCA
MTVQAPPTTATQPATGLPERIRRHAELTPDTIALREKSLGIWRGITWAEYAEQVDIVAHSLAALGIGVGDRVGILSENRPEWLYADIAILSIRAVTVGFYTTNPAPEVRYQLVDCGAKVLFAEDQEQVDKVLAVEKECPDLEWIVYFDRRGVSNYDHPKLISYEDLLGNGVSHRSTHPDHVSNARAAAQPDDLATLVYTSGTTGPPKGAMLSVRNVEFSVAHLISGNWLISPAPGPTDVILSYLPLCHVAERAFTIWQNAGAGVVVHFAESLDTVTNDLAEVQPTLLFAVPRIWEKLASTVAIKAASASPLKRAASAVGRRLAEKCAAQRSANGGDHTAVSRICTALGYPLVFRSLQNKLGLRKVRTAISGAAPISPDVLEFFLGIGIPIYEAYGMTENSALATSTRLHRMKLGTVGEAADGLEVKLDEHTNEVLTRHDGNFVGYWNRPDATAATLDADGWLHTGDVGQWVDGTYLKIVDRMKDIIITAGGKNVSPSEIENQLKASPYIAEAVVIGDRRPYLTALIGIEFDAVSDWATRNGIHYTTYKDLSSKPEVVALVGQAVDDANAHFARVETIRKFRMLTKELDHEDGELTATRKVKRSALADKFADLIDDMYRGESR